MRLATLRTPKGLRLALWNGASTSPSWIDLQQAAAACMGRANCPAALADLLRTEGAGLETPREILGLLVGKEAPEGVERWSAEEVRFAPPVPAPGAFLDFYAFEDHVRGARARRGLDVPEEWYRFPVYYRSNQRAFLGQGDEVWFPPGETMMDYELELAAVLGERIERPSAEAAQQAIAGYCLLNDWSARAIQREVMKVGLGPNKGKDFGTSLGPWLVTPDEAGDLGRLTLSARVNGEAWSRSSFGAVRWSWGEMIAFAAEDAVFEAGDVFGSGTLGGGCGLEKGRFLKPGNRVDLDGGELFGVLSGTVRQREVDP